jgi:hypothetical protein
VRLDADRREHEGSLLGIGKRAEPANLDQVGHGDHPRRDRRSISILASVAPWRSRGSCRGVRRPATD